MPETFITLLTAHLLGDFPFQPDWMVSHKKKLLVLVLHAGVVTALTALLLGAYDPTILAVTFGSHTLIDFVKARLPQRPRAFVADQLAHVAVLLGLAWWLPNAAGAGWWFSGLRDYQLGWYYAGLSFVSGIILIVHVGGILVGQVTAPFVAEIREHLRKSGESYHEGLTNGGKLIGWLERALVMGLILINQAGGIGLLIAAKSILRFGEIKERKDRMFAEYVLIGTLLSVGWAILVSTLTQQAILHWLPQLRGGP